jgi:Icc-related predicted phosphoesterase
MKLVAISDTHLAGSRGHIEVPDGDVLVHCDDLTFRGTQEETAAELAWLNAQPHEHIIVVAGNHDWFFEKNAPDRFRGWDLKPRVSVDEMLDKFPALTYLQDQAVTIDGVKFYGAPWQPPFCGWAFNMAGEGFDSYGMPSTYAVSERHPNPPDVWAKIPDDTNVLITHGPPRGILDSNSANPNDPRQNFGCVALRARIAGLRNLKLHVFGHIHGPGSHTEVHDGVTFGNCAICTEAYEPIRAPLVFDL